ncbi:MAG: LicD family protein, partial [Elusimicrobia bacterium]|nr:LicD family protein [Elusimicrobiota bacterium]
REKGDFLFKEIPLYYGRKIIDTETAKQNLIDFKKIMDKNSVFFGLIYGTLLGAVRDKGFIPHDEDTDVFVLDEDRVRLLELLEEFQEHGFEVARYGADLLSLIRNDDYVDIYFFRKGIFSKISGESSVPNHFFKKYTELDFYKHRYFVFEKYEKLLLYAYGKDWKVPKENSPAAVLSNYSKIKIFIKKILPNSIVDLLKKLKKGS